MKNKDTEQCTGAGCHSGSVPRWGTEVIQATQHDQKKKKDCSSPKANMYLEGLLLGSHVFIQMENKLVALSVFWDLVTVPTACSLLSPQKHDSESQHV